MVSNHCDSEAADSGASVGIARGSAALSLVLTLVVGATSGCSVWQQARRTMLHEPRAYPWKFDRQRSLKAYRSWAEQAWQAESASCPDGPASEHFEFGFKDGFVDFVYAGGDGQPPPVPPRKYWNLTWRSLQGHSAADEWFAGYRRGAKAARAGGYRNLGIVYSSLRAGGQPAAAEPLLLGPPQATSEDVSPPDELLPAPASTVKGPPIAGGRATAPDVDQPRGAAAEAAPVPGAPLDAGDGAEAAASGHDAPPPLPTPPASALEPSPFDARPDDSSRGAALMFRRAISAATSSLPPNAPTPAWMPSTNDPYPTSSSPVDAGPPAWPVPALGAAFASPDHVTPASAASYGVTPQPGTHRNVLRHPEN